MSYTIIDGLKLRRGSLYEFIKKPSSQAILFNKNQIPPWKPGTLHHSNLLGAYRGAEDGIAYFSVLADSDGSPWHYSQMAVGLKDFEFLKLVPIEDLPLYVGWPWKTHFFTKYLKG